MPEHLTFEQAIVEFPRECKTVLEFWGYSDFLGVTAENLIYAALQWLFIHVFYLQKRYEDQDALRWLLEKVRSALVAEDAGLKPGKEKDDAD